MKEQLISFETAKLAKEKNCSLKIFGKGYEYTDEDGNRYWTSKENGIDGDKNTQKVVECTQSLLQKWLRDVYNIAVLVSFNDNTCFEYYYFIHTDVSKECSNRICSLPFKSNNYEAALEKGLQEALKLIEV